MAHLKLHWPLTAVVSQALAGLHGSEQSARQTRQLGSPASAQPRMQASWEAGFQAGRQLASQAGEQAGRHSSREAARRPDRQMTKQPGSKEQQQRVGSDSLSHAIQPSLLAQPIITALSH